MHFKTPHISIMNSGYASFLTVSALAAASILSSCHREEFRISGSVTHADSIRGKALVLERPGLDGSWIAVDSTGISGSGNFSFRGDAPQASEIFRIRLADSFIYIPIDSVEKISVEADARSFGSSFSVTGSDNATALASFEKELIAAIPHLSQPDSAHAFKRRVFTSYLQDSKGSVVSYYILTKTVGGRPLFSPESDHMYFSAVATAYSQYRPDDPRTPLLEEAAREGRRLSNRAKGNSTVVKAGEISMIEIELPDENGMLRPLSALTGNGKPTILVFSNMTQEGAPAFNLGLRNIMSEKNGRADIYQVSFDASRHAWSDAASNLPWTTVYAAQGEAASKVATDYNVGSLPAIFIYDASGALTDRAEDLDDLRKKLSNY